MGDENRIVIVTHFLVLLRNSSAFCIFSVNGFVPDFCCVSLGALHCSQRSPFLMFASSRVENGVSVSLVSQYRVEVALLQYRTVVIILQFNKDPY